MKRLNITLALIMCLLVAVSSVFISCDKSDDLDTNQIKGGVSLNVAQLQVTRGGYMQFKGSGLDQIETIVFPTDVAVSDIEVVDEYTIRCIVPEEAIEGKVNLLYEDKSIETGIIAFTEPITFESFTPAAVTAGDELTIKGTYLNYIDQVMFANGEAVDVSPTRYEIKVPVPVDASTGKVYLVMKVMDGEDEITNMLPSNEELVVAEPADIELPTSAVKAGSTISITGSLLRLVEFVRFQNADDVNVAQDDPTKDITSLSATVPVDATSGAVTLVLLSGIEVAAGDISLVEPTATIEDLKPSYGVDETVVITGTDLDLFTTASFTGDEATEVVLTEGKLNMKVTAAAQSGPITLTTANGTVVSVEGFETTKPEATFPTSATPLDELNIESTLSNRVKTVMFGDLEAEATDNGTGFTVIVPLEAETGSVILVMDNEETVVVGDITINAYTFCAVSEFASETTTIGDLLRCTVVNGSNLTDVKLNDVSTGFILNGNTLFVNVGYSVGSQKMTLVSNDGTEVNYDVEVVGAGLVETILYDIPLEVVGWGGATLPYVVDVPLPANAKIRIRVAQANSELQVMDGYWGMGPNWAITDDAKKNVIKFSPEELSAGYVDVDFSVFHDENDSPWWDGKIMFNADGVIVSSISMIIDYSAPTAIWTGLFDLGSWQGNQDLAWGGYDWSTVKAGQTLYFSFTMNAGNTWGCLSLRHGDGWGNLPTEGSGQIDFGASDTQGTYVLTQADIDDLVANGGLVFTGANLTVTQVAIK
nr:hypothetical protein [uncultured Carboxylicivirga sp.]